MTPEREARLRSAAAEACDLGKGHRFPIGKRAQHQPEPKQKPEPPKPRRYIFGIDVTELFDEPETDLGDDWEAPVLAFRRR